PQNLSEIASRSGAGRRVRNDYLLGSLSLLGSFLFNYLSIQPFNYFSIGAKRLSLCSLKTQKIKGRVGLFSSL
ncbi:hypothetical protein KAW18_10450, partial [candidate division WOR-3 bacterium]|nr:hypothetical protein [candidate division WOR-3 bacterium]